LRLESEGVLKSWAVPKGPSLDPAQKRLAVAVEDHPSDYGDFEGVIPEGEYGAGKVIIWDRGVFQESLADGRFEDMLAKGTAKITLEGAKLKGRFALIRTAMGGNRKNWLLVKEMDDEARPGSDITLEKPLSVVSGRDVEEIGAADG
jgi:bifunctional non-homologous end joining protein LigD